jgi:hypothetical protein
MKKCGKRCRVQSVTALHVYSSSYRHEEAETGRIAVQGQPRQRVGKTPSQQQQQKKLDKHMPII